MAAATRQRTGMSLADYRQVARTFLAALPNRQVAKDTLAWMDSHSGIPRWVVKQLGGIREVLARQNGCLICGATALYRVGTRGFCRKHKSRAVQIRAKARQRYYEPRAADWEQRLREEKRKDVRHQIACLTLGHEKLEREQARRK